MADASHLGNPYFSVSDGICLFSYLFSRKYSKRGVEQLLECVLAAADSILNRTGTARWLKSLILDGIIPGVGSVLSFLPNMIILFFALSVLEDSGYMPEPPM